MIDRTTVWRIRTNCATIFLCGAIFGALLVGACESRSAAALRHERDWRTQQLRIDRVYGAVYFRDALGRCLELGTLVTTVDGGFAHSGNLRIHVVRGEACDTGAEVAAEPPLPGVER